MIVKQNTQIHRHYKYFLAQLYLRGESTFHWNKTFDILNKSSSPSYALFGYIYFWKAQNPVRLSTVLEKSPNLCHCKKLSEKYLNISPPFLIQKKSHSWLFKESFCSSNDCEMRLAHNLEYFNFKLEV